MGICQGWRAELSPQGQGREVPGRQEGRRGLNQVQTGRSPCNQQGHRAGRPGAWKPQEAHKAV